MPLRRTVPFLTVLLLSSGPVLAQSTRPHALEQGSWAVLYQLEDAFRLNFFDGMLAVKYHLSKRDALRFGIGGNASTSNDNESAQGGVSGQVQYFRYLQPEHEVKFYLGAGPRVGYDVDRRNFGPSARLRDENWEFGLAGRLGTEWFATQHISIFAEYGNFVGSEVQDRQITPTESRVSHDAFYRTSITLGVGAYL